MTNRDCAVKKILIDGYNLLNSRAFSVAGHLDLEGKRDHLLKVLKSYGKQEGLHISVVFDNARHPVRQVSRSKNFLVIFCRPGEEADDELKKMIRKAAGSSDVAVISSDRSIQFTAKDHGVAVISSEAFCRMMRTPSAAPARSAPPPQVPKDLTAKYNSNISEKEVQYWKDLFRRDNGDE